MSADSCALRYEDEYQVDSDSIGVDHQNHIVVEQVVNAELRG